MLTGSSSVSIVSKDSDAISNQLLVDGDDVEEEKEKICRKKTFGRLKSEDQKMK